MNRPTTHKTAECCSDMNCAHGLRNKYFDGKRLTADSFRVEQKYLIERRWLLNRAIHGWGVVYGFGITPTGPAKSTGPGRLRIGAGLALDQCGRELLQTERPIEVNELIVLDEKGVPTDPETAVSEPDPIDRLRGEDNKDECWLLSVHYAEQYTGLVKIKDPCQCEYDEWDRTCETVRYSLRRIPCEDCCADFDCELDCECATGPCCGAPPDTDKESEREREKEREKEREEREREERERERERQQRETYTEGRVAFRETFAENPGEFHEVDIGNREDFIAARIGEQARPTETRPETPQQPEKPASSHKRGGCRCLCEHVTRQNPGKDCDGLCEIEEPCGSVWVDLKNGVPIACVKLVRDDCDRLTFEDVEECGPRRLVKGNDLLFDLIRGCDLTRIKDFGWKDLHRESVPIEFKRFREAFGEKGEYKDGHVTQDFWVEFSRPVVRDTVRRDCFVMTIIFAEHHDGWWETYRVPIVRVEAANADLIDRATIVVDGHWFREIFGNDATNLFQGKVTRVEIEVRGDFIVDCNGQTVDANPRGREPLPTGNGTPGGTFLSTFLVGPADPPDRPQQSYREDRIKGVS